MKDTENKKKVALIVGGSSGIGYQCGIKLSEAGCTVYNASRGNAEYESIRNLNIDAEKSETIDAAVEELWEKEGRIDVLIYSAGYSMAAPIEHAKSKDVRRLFEINYFGALETVQMVLPHMKECGGGRIILVSSMGGIFPIAFDSFYSSSKAALDMFARSLAIEVEPYGIYVTSVQPGGVATRFTFKRNVYSAEDVGEYSDRIEKAVAALEKKEQCGMSPALVADDIIALINAKNPPVTAAVGTKNKTFKLARKILPERICDSWNKNMYES